jgi:hypothetical protein
MNIGEILITSWKITWKHKVLWLFGLLVALAQAVNVLNQIFRIVTQSNVLTTASYRDLGSLLINNPYIFGIGLVLLACGMMLVLMVFSTIGQIGMIKGAVLADSVDDIKLSFGELFKAVKTYFWRIFGISAAFGFGILILLGFFYAIIIGGAVGGVFLARNSGAASITSIMGLAFLCMMPFLCVFIILSTVISTIMLFAFIALINDDLGLVAAFGRSIQLIKKNFWQIVLAVIVIGAVGGILGFIIALPLGLTGFVPLMALGSREIAGATVWISVLCLLAYMPILVFTTAIVSVYTHTIWTLTYRRLSASAIFSPESIQGAIEPVSE